MANGAMKYVGEKEDADFTLSGSSHVYNYTETYNTPKVMIDGWTGNNKPTITTGSTSCTIEGSDGDSGHITVIESQ
jgi:hypothetical protein